MPFKFTIVCELLQDLEKLITRDPPYLRDRLEQETKRAIVYWFRANRPAINAADTDGVALLSTLFPEKRTDRIYLLQEARLWKIIARCLRLNQAKTKVLESWKSPGSGGLALCVQRVLKDFDCEAKPGAFVTVEEVDTALQNLAARVRFSGTEIRSSAPLPASDKGLENIFKRLSSIDAKWLTRLILKKFSPVELDYYLITKEFHFLLPDLLKVQDSFSAAVALLRGPLSKYTSNPDAVGRRIMKAEAAKLFVPAVGVKVSRQTYVKARSMEHCINMCGSQVWSVERKYDGELCEIHVNLHRDDKCIQIFSKSNKDSTEDRNAVIENLRERLRIGKPDCAFKWKCIIVGELVAWSDSQEKILEFHHIRKHVTRSGMRLGAAQDSPIEKGERLMVILFDLLMIDDEIVLQKPYKERRERLKKVIRCKVGYAMTAERNLIDFSKGQEAHEALCLHFAAALAQRYEGLVLKPLNMPYFRFDYDGDRDDKSFLIKLKKDYLLELGGLRDVVDFAVIGASYDPNLAPKSKIRVIRYTTFHLGCCVNKDKAVRYDEIPIFETVGMITLDQCIPQAELQALNDYGYFQNRPFERAGSKLKCPEKFDLRLGPGPECKIDVLFTEPCVVEVLGSGYDKPSNKRYFMLRHPRIQKVHLDRSWQDACCFTELQELAREARNTPEGGVSQEYSQLVKTLTGKVVRKMARDRGRHMSTQRTTPRTTQRTESPSSPSFENLTKTAPVNATSPVINRRSAARISPVLVRVDTGERIPGNSVPAFSSPSKQPRKRTTPSGSLPSPPRPAPEPLQNPPQPSKRLLSEGSECQQKRPRLAEQTPTRVTLSTALSTISNNSAQRRSVRVQERRRSSRNSAATPKSSRNLNPILSCHNPKCPFTKSILFLTDCVSAFKWVSETLTTWHSTELIPELGYWSRETIEVDSPGSVVAESYSYPGQQKMILVESGRLEATMKIVEEVKKMKIRDLVLFFDWRVLEDWKDAEAEHSQDLEGLDAREVFEQRFFGFTNWYSVEEEVVFKHKDFAKMPRMWLDE